MKILEAAARKTLLGVGLLLLRELRRLTYAIEMGVDTFRAVHGHRPLFHQTFHGEHLAESGGAEFSDSRTIPRYESDEPDWLRLDLLESLCREHHIAITDGMDLVQVGREMGWIDEAGQIVVLPAHYGE